MAPAVLFRAAVVLAGRFPALAGVDLVVAPGEIVVLEGPNGAGKTSLLRACAGLLRVSDGQATVLGVDLRRDPVGVRRAVGLLGHEAALYDDLTVAENLRFAARAARPAPAGAGARPAAAAEAATERLGLTGRLARTPAGRLSAGQPPGHGGWPRSAPGPSWLPRRGCSTADGPRPTGPGPTSWPRSTPP